MILEVLEAESRESLEKLDKKEVIDILFDLCIKHDPKAIQGSLDKEQNVSDAIVKLGMFMVMYHVNQKTKQAERN